MGRGYVDLHDIQMHVHGANRFSGGGNGLLYTLDTNVIMEANSNPNFWDMLMTRLNLRGAQIHFDSVVRRELEKHGCPVERMVARARMEAGATVGKGPPAHGIAGLAASLERRYPTLHSPDSYILAGCIRAGTMLVTRDRGLERAARAHGVKVINPDMLATGHRGRA